MSFHVSVADAIAQLRREKEKRFVQLMAHGRMSVEYYAPRTSDPQQPHAQDEVYVVVSGTGKFYCDGQTIGFSTGDVLFVPAGVEHRFKDFSNDFATWVIFY
jgi:mannose-6-phosphate isomerase-like protein (cupin superfamily)